MSVILTSVSWAMCVQNLVKRDKDGYKDEFLQQQRNYLSELEIFKLKVCVEPSIIGLLLTGHQGSYRRGGGEGGGRKP